jgi:SecD/SecF fusion protein
MSKTNRWQLGLILAVIGLTLYNILPTLFFYGQPLKQSIDKRQGQEIAKAAMDRANMLEDDAISFLASFNKMLSIKAKKIEALPENPAIIAVSFSSEEEANTFKTFLPRAGSLIAFYPAQLGLAKGEREESPNTVYVQRRVPIHFSSKDQDKYFEFATLVDPSGVITKEYAAVLEDRALEVALSLGGAKENANLLYLATAPKEIANSFEVLPVLAKTVVTIDKLFSDQTAIAKKFYQTFTQGPIENKKEAVKEWIQRTTAYKEILTKERLSLEEKKNPESKEEIAALQEHEDLLLKALSILRHNEAAFVSTQDPWQASTIGKEIHNHFLELKETQEIAVSRVHPLFKALQVDFTGKNFSLILQDDLLHLKEKWEKNPKEKGRLDLLTQLIYNEIAKINRETSENFTPNLAIFSTPFTTLPETHSFLIFPLDPVLKSLYATSKKALNEEWHPYSHDLQKEIYPLVEWKEYKNLPVEEASLKLVLYSPEMDDKTTPIGFRPNSVYVIAKDLGAILQKFSTSPNNPQTKALREDFQQLYELLSSYGFIGYPGTTYPLPQEYAKDYIFEARDFYQPVLMATRENFQVQGTKRFAILEFSTQKERLLALNRIETKMHEDLLKWRDEYYAAKVDPTGAMRFTIPEPTKNILWNNTVLSWKKYFRGDERKVLRWGLDLTGGKTVQIALRDSNNRLVTEDASIKQGINELYNRVNKMGVSDVSIRQEGSTIALDFPSSQGISSEELIKASKMTFHIVNEKFSSPDTALYAQANQFLQEVWNEAVVTNRKGIKDINLIAWNHLYGESLDPNAATPRSELAKALYNQGLRLTNPDFLEMSGDFNTEQSMVALFKGDEYAQWHGQSHPLLFVFKNYALEGSNLERVHAGYDPSKGNFLSFEIKSGQTTPSGEKIAPRKILYSWSSVFSKDKVLGTAYETAARGKGWRMAVVLNGVVVSAPHLEAALSDSGMITGHFTTREVQRLVSDLQAGSLSFTPEILSEQNISPDLGWKERVQGITATLLSLAAVIVVMIGYYRFGGLIASIAVLFNLLIIWATLQNIGATITLPGLAGIILTVGMAVDANVLVFERVREEFAVRQKLLPALQAGYKKAFSAIVDSNVTTIIAALILLNFDSGPIKGFALTLIIGIVSSMFTALFMTRYFFNKWAQNPKHKELRMANLIRPHNWNFTRWNKAVLALSMLIIVSGAALFPYAKKTLFGMDFTGGFSTTLAIQPSQEGNYRSRVEEALLKKGLSSQEVQVRELSPENKLRIFFSPTMNLEGKPFYAMPNSLAIDHPNYPYETNPRLVWLVNTLEQASLPPTEKSLQEVDLYWKSVSGQMSESMRNNAILGLTLAMVAILLYITLRFEFTYAISATLGLAFDLFITLAALVFLHLLHVPLQVDLNTVAALMTIIGYSLNDTIIVFDRIREDRKLMKHMRFKDIVNHALNVTLSRTILTSATTLVVLLCLVVFGGSTLFGFSLLMAIGVIVGTFSTFFIACGLLIFFQKRETYGEDDDEKISIEAAPASKGKIVSLENPPFFNGAQT